MRRLTEITIGVCLLVLWVRTFLAMGLLLPVVVHGSSMAPRLSGAGILASCPDCHRTLRVGVDQLPNSAVSPCPLCGHGELNLENAQPLPGDPILVDRLSLDLAPIRRWETVVHRLPDDARRLAVKRVLGLPGETIALCGGDVWINGRRVVKTLEEQQRTRQLVHHETGGSQHWRRLSGEWVWRRDSWHGVAKGSSPSQLVYAPPDDAPIQDSMASNLTLTRRLNVVNDRMLELRARLSQDARLEVWIEGERRRTSSLWDAKQSGCAQATLLLSTFDAAAVASLADQNVAVAVEPCETRDRKIGVTLHAGKATISKLTLWRDIYYEPHPDGPLPGTRHAWRVESAAYFVAGDNQAFSFDGRTWNAGPSLPRRLLLGRVKITRAGGQEYPSPGEKNLR